MGQASFPRRARIRHRAEFCASFRLENPDFDEAWNRETFGACHSPHFHGHNYLLEVEVEGPVDPRTGMVYDLQRLADLVRERIVEAVDHRNLNLDVGFLQGIIPTSENLAIAFWERLAPELPPPTRLVRILLRESRDDEVLYLGPERA